MAPKARRTLQIVGPILLVGGLALFVVAGILPFVAIMRMSEPSPDGFRSFGTSFLVSIALTFVSMLAFIAGGICTTMGYRKPMSELASTDTELAVETTASALGRGLSRGGLGGVGGGIRVRCRSCGALETEDARFCSSCARPM